MSRSPLSASAGQLTRWWSWLIEVDPGWDGRLVVLVAVAGYGLAVTVAQTLYGVDLWRILGVPSGPLLFVDTHNLTAAGECMQRGIDPFVSNPCDIDARPWNYSRLWLLLGAFGMDLDWTVPLALITIVAFLAAVYLLVDRLTAGEGIVVSAIVCSPAVMFAIEHAQADLLIFVLVVAAVGCWRAGGRWRVLSPVWVLLAALLKLFPILALGAHLLSQRRRVIVMALVCATTFVAYWATRPDELLAIAERAPQGEYHSFGARILLSYAARRAGFDGAALGGALGQVVVVLLLAAMLSTLVWWAWSRMPRSLAHPVDWRLHAFHLGALIYLGSFAVFNSWDYRLIFLLLLVPQSFMWLRSDEPTLRTWAAVTFTLVIVQVYLGAALAYWTLDETRVDYGRLPAWSLGDELVTWSLAAVLALLLVPSLREATIWLAHRGSTRRTYPPGRTRRAER